LVLTAFFQHAPIIPGAEFSVLEDDLHSKLATVVGFSFVFFAISAVFIVSTRRRKIIAVGIAIIAMLIFNFEDFAGIWQRMMFIIMFAWLMYFLYGIGCQ
jgi:hypothetical protein